MVTCVYFVPNFPNFSLFCVPVGTTILIIVKHGPRPCKNHAKLMLCKNHAKFAPLVAMMVQHSFNLWLPKLAQFLHGKHHWLRLWCNICAAYGSKVGTSFAWGLLPKWARVLHREPSQVGTSLAWGDRLKLARVFASVRANVGTYIDTRKKS